MPTPTVPAQRRSRLRWYLGVVGLLGSFTMTMQLTTAPGSAPSIALSATGLLVFLAELGAALFFGRVAGTAGLVHLLRGALLWFGAAGIALWLSGPLDRLIPWALFLVAPCLNALWTAQELRGD